MENLLADSEHPFFEFSGEESNRASQSKATSASPEVLESPGFFNFDILQDLQVWDELGPMSDFTKVGHQENAYTPSMTRFAEDPLPLSGGLQFSNMSSHSWPG